MTVFVLVTDGDCACILTFVQQSREDVILSKLRDIAMKYSLL